MSNVEHAINTWLHNLHYNYNTSECREKTRFFFVLFIYFAKYTSHVILYLSIIRISKQVSLQCTGIGLHHTKQFTAKS